MKVLIIGGVAAGTKAAAKLKRELPGADITIFTKEKKISYAGCGLPYLIGGSIEDEAELIVNTPEKFAALTGVAVETGCEAVALDPTAKTISIRRSSDGPVEAAGYDRAVIAVGASPLRPDAAGAELPGVFTLRTPADASAIRGWAEREGIRRAVVVGGGFIGLEVAENLKARGIQVTLLEASSQLLPGIFDPEMADYLRRHLLKNGFRVITGAKAEAFLGDSRITAVRTGAGTLPADLAVLSIGIRPNTDFLAGSGIAMEKGAIVVDRQMRTNLPDVYAAGDCALVTNRITGKPQYSPMGSSANLEGRVLARVIAGEEAAYPGVLGTGIVRLPGLNCGRTGLSEAQAAGEGYDVMTALAVTDDKAHYYPGAATFITKLVADRQSRRLLGAQVFGPGSVDKMIDIAATGIAAGMTLDDFDSLDLAYAPPFSTAIHPLVQAVYVLLNKLSGAMVSMTPAEYAAGKAQGRRVIDVSRAPAVPGATYVALDKVQGPIDGIGTDEPLLLVCTKGRRAYLLQRKLAAFGYTDTVVLEGSTSFCEVKAHAAGTSVPPEEVARVKGLGFLRDKNTADRFNGRVITRNGKITAEESRAISEAAERFGSGEIAMTSRLTVEIQGVPFDSIEPMREFLMQAGLETGGTGSKVRPVVSCKGTTCQYGLIDTFSLSEEIHERFYHGYSHVKLPHKFKIAVGGCPNNCVKPDLNDLGIIGQRVPEPNLELCRGCKVCQIEAACPIKVAKMEDGKIAVDSDACNHCGRCLGKCPFKVFERSTNGYRIYIGGRWGKKVAQGRCLDRVFTDRAEVLDVVEKAILLFREQGITGERFAGTVARLGFENVQEQLLSDELLARKQDNIASQKHLVGGATC